LEERVDPRGQGSPSLRSPTGHRFSATFAAQPTMRAHSIETSLRALLVAVVATFALPGCGWLEDRGVTNKDLLAAQSRLGMWVHNGRDYAARRYSPDDQINRENVDRLEVVWKYDTGVTVGGFETSAIVFDDRIYITTAGNHLIRLDPATGKPVWEWKSGLRFRQNRGAAVFGKRIYMGTIDAHLMCFDVDTGLMLWDRIVGDDRAGYHLTGAPLIVDGKVIVGIGGAEEGIRGFIDAYDAETGKQVWRFWVIPAPGEPGSETWEGDSWVHGGGSAWLTGTYDPELHLLYWATGNPAPDFDGEARRGDNLYTNSIVALNPDTGGLVWYFQNTPHDLFDWDGVSEPILVDETIDGRPTKAIVQANRNGYLYVLDRTDGTFLSATPYTKVNWAIRDANGKPVMRPELVHAKVRHVWPGTVGGTNWPPKAYSPRTHLIYIPDIVRGATFTSQPAIYQRGLLYMGGFARYDDAPAEGSIEAMDVRTGEIAWSFDTKGPNWGGLLATAGGLVFGGAFDGNLRAFNDETGEVLWEFQTGTGVYAPPTTFRIGGKQFVGLASGYGFMGDATSGRPRQPRQGLYYLFGLAED
jgi:alcohol dehydrogenase (cytochrome c)